MASNSQSLEKVPLETEKLVGVRMAALTVVLFWAMMMSALPHYAISVAAPVLMIELEIGEALLGAITASLYIIGAATARLASRLLDAMSGRVGLALLGVLATGSLLTIAASRNVGMLFAAAILGGASMGLNNPATNRVISLHVPDGRRGIVIGLKQSGVKAAQIVAGSALPLLVILVGWRSGTALLAAACTGVLILSVWAVPAVRTTFGTPSRAAISTVRSEIRWLRLYSLCMAFSVASSTTYIALYAVTRIGMELTTAGLLVTLFGLTGMISRIIWAAIAERIGRAPLVLVVLSAGGLVGLGLIAATERIAAVWPIWVGVALTGVTIGTWNVIAQLTVVREVPSTHAATATGSVHAAFAIGLAAGPAAFGVIVEFSGSFLLGWSSTATTCAIALIIAALEQARRSRGESRLVV